MTWRKHLFDGVAPHYHIDLDEITHQLQASINEHGIIEMKWLDEMTREELIHTAQYAVAVMEYVGGKRDLVSKLLRQQEGEYDKTRAEVTKELGDTLRDPAGKPLGDNKLRDLVKGEQRVLDFQKKIACYEAYASYLDRFIKMLDNIHFLAKSMTRQEWRERPQD